MGSLFMFFVVLGALTTGILYYVFPHLFVDVELPDIEDQYFGPGPKLTNPDDFPKDKTEIKKFKIHVEESVLQDLKDRLKASRYVTPLGDVGFRYGFRGDYLQEVVKYWSSKYDWRAQEMKLNKFSHFKTQIEGLDVHFIHEKPKSAQKVHVVPIMLIHGWPGSFVEFTKILSSESLAMSASGKQYALELIVPSIPGYAFSEAPHQPGFNAISAARVFAKLMDRLGFKQFYVQGGDWGSLIASNMAKMYPKRVLGVHTNVVPFTLDAMGWLKYAVGFVFPSLFMSVEEQADIYPMSKLSDFFMHEGGYFHIQATKPDTVSAALADSPAGLAAYILEKFSTWTNQTYVNYDDGHLTERFSLDDLLTNVMIYWTTNSIASSARFYKENSGDIMGKGPLKNIPVKVPSGISVFPQELAIFPKSLITSQLRDLVHYERLPEGGHFPAMEVPEALIRQIWKFIMKVETRKEKH